MYPHCFGFPTFPASEHMTPLIISGLLAVASLHSGNYTNLFEGLKADIVTAIKPDQAMQLTPDQELDPEIGIGVEEITGACLFATWLGGELGWQIARVARWWTLAYLRLFSRRNEATLGEALTILPPFRNIEEADRLRVWLMAYVTEAHTCLINERKGLLEREDAREYTLELRRVLEKKKEAGTNGADGAKVSVPGSATYDGGLPPSDRHLIGHTEMANVLLKAQEICIDLRRALAAGQPLIPAGETPTDGWIASADFMMKEWDQWMHRLERWRLEIGLMEGGWGPISTPQAKFELTRRAHSQTCLLQAALQPTSLCRSISLEPIWAHWRWSIRFPIISSAATAQSAPARSKPRKARC